MKLTSLEITDYPPIKNLKIEDMGDVVIIAGANGSGKTRLKTALLETLQGSPQMSLTIKSSRNDETEAFGGEYIQIQKGQQNEVLNQYMNSRRFGRGRYVGSLVQIDSQRNIKTTTYNQVRWLVADPDDTDTASNFYCQEFTNRWQDFMNYIHQKVAAYHNKLAEAVTNGSKITASKIKKRIPHPLDKYKKIFGDLLPGKELQDINPESPSEFRYKDHDGSILSFSTLSSGEQEIVKVIFDVARKEIRDSIIVVDEPELHLHPTLTFKLIETLKSIGDHTNQYIFLTHSADLISTYFSTGNVYFIDSDQGGNNQAHRLSDLNHSHSELVQLIGENLGLFAVGKKLVFVEGEDSSIDKLAYQLIAQKYLPDANIVHVGSVENLIVLNTLEQQIRNSIFGINLYMVRDRDGLSDSQIQTLEGAGRIKCLKKRHLENYFLDAEVLYRVAEKLYITSAKPEITTDYIKTKLNEIALGSQKLNLLQNVKDYVSVNFRLNIPTVRSIESKDIEAIKTEFSSEIARTLSNLEDGLSEGRLTSVMTVEEQKIDTALQDGTWVNTFQGKYIFKRFCSDVFGEDELKVRHAYVDIALKEKPEVFDDIKLIFESFN